jgi:hypothetical protein
VCPKQISGSRTQWYHVQKGLCKDRNSTLDTATCALEDGTISITKSPNISVNTPYPGLGARCPQTNILVVWYIWGKIINRNMYLGLGHREYMWNIKDSLTPEVGQQLLEDHLKNFFCSWTWLRQTKCIIMIWVKFDFLNTKEAAKIGGSLVFRWQFKMLFF